MASPMLDRFIGEIRQLLETKNGDELQRYLIIEPPFSESYSAIIDELRQRFPDGSQDRLEKKCESLLPEYEDDGSKGGSWPAFISFLVQYFNFVRDVNASKLVETHDMIKSLLSQSVLALSDTTMGISVLPSVVGLSKQLSRLSIGLEKHPELMAKLKPTTPTAAAFSSTASEANERTTLVESSANTIREAFSKCLSERSAGGPGAPGPPAGRRVGIYLLANLCLRLFFHCRKLRSAEQIFGNIYAQSPPLDRFPASQRVTFLYYLGRYHFANNHFIRAQKALHAAYNQCHNKCLQQRRLILIQLITCNIIIGRFPSAKLLLRPEALHPVSLREIFSPVCEAIKRGDLAGFDRALDPDSSAGAWMLKCRVLLQLRNRCEVLVWRSLARRLFLLVGFKGNEGKSAPRLDVGEMTSVVVALNNAAHSSREDYVDADFEGDEETEDEVQPNVTQYDVEAALASLVRQGLLHGYMSHKHGKFVITGAKTKPAIEVGFPNVWNTLMTSEDEHVPGWVTETMNGRPQAGGRTVHLKGARPAGF